MARKRPLRATDRRRNYHKVEADDEKSSTGSGHPLASLFTDRRKRNGTGKRAG